MKIFVSTVLGSPAAECAHFGICKMEVLPPEEWDAFKPQHARHAKATLSITENGRLRFEFPKSGMRARTFIDFFSTGSFRVDSEGFIPGYLAEALGTVSQIIVPGIYTLQIGPGEAVLELEIIAQKKTGKALSPHVCCAIQTPLHAIRVKLEV